MTRLMIVALLATVATTPLVARAEDEISANVALTTDYRFRGISQTQRDPAIQGGFDWGHDSGVYVGAWASNVSFTDGGSEIDVYAGWAGELSESVSVDVGVLYYGYPSDSDADYVEIYGSIGFAGATLGLNFSPEYTFDTGDYFYLYGDYSLPLGESGLTLDAHLGWNLFEDEQALGSFLGAVDPGDNYIDYSIGITFPVSGVDVAVAYVGTDIDRSDCFGGTKDCRGNAVVTVSKSF